MDEEDETSLNNITDNPVVGLHEKDIYVTNIGDLRNNGNGKVEDQIKFD